MALRQSSNPYGYKNLLVYKKAEELQRACAEFTSHFSHSPPYTLSALADQMDRSARSVKQNIVEGWKRNSTREYYDFLGFSIGANAELEEDCDDIVKGIYEMVGRGKGGGKEWTMDEIERLPFYPLDTRLPPLIQLKLRCKEINFLLTKLQQSLASKMQAEHTLARKDVLSRAIKNTRDEDRWYETTLEAEGLVRLPDGQIVKRGEKGKRGEMGKI